MRSTHAPTVARTDLNEITPDRLSDSIDYTVYNQFTDFEHRGHRCEVNRMISYLGAALENTAVKRGEDSTPVVFSEIDAVDIVVDALAKKFPAWFGDDSALEELDEPTSDQHLSKSDLKNIYYNGELAPDTQPVDGDNWTDQKRVIIPLLAIALNTLRDQIKADSEVGTNAAQQTIKRTILREAYKHDLDEADIDLAVDAAKQLTDELP